MFADLLSLQERQSFIFCLILFPCVSSALASMVARAWMESMPSPASVCLGSLAATANMTSMSAIQNRASMEAPVLTVMGHTNAPALMDTQE